MNRKRNEEMWSKSIFKLLSYLCQKQKYTISGTLRKKSR